MARIWYLALVDRTDTSFSSAFARHDETVFSFSIQQAEGDFCALSVVIEKPSQSLLDPARPQWVWFSVKEGMVTTPLFFGRVVGVPADIQSDLVTIEFLAKPADFDEQKRALAATMRVLPFWDWAYVDPQMADDPDAVMEARTEVWDIDRVTHTLTSTSIIEGEDGTIDLTAAEMPEDSFSLSYRETPLRKVQLELRAMWTQQLQGEIDLTPTLLAAFEAAGSPRGFVTSYTGTGLYDDWPAKDDNIGNVYAFGTQTITPVDGKAVKTKYKAVSVRYERKPADTKTATADNLRVLFKRWTFAIDTRVNYEIEIDRTEDIRFNVLAEIQDIVNDADDQVAEVITLSSGNIGVSVGPGGVKEVPIGDVRRDAYFSTARGNQSIRYGLAHARALLLRRARTVEIRVTVPVRFAIEASCRKSLSLVHPNLPGETAIGKIVAYEFGVDGEDGAEFGTITIACMAGKNTGLTVSPGTPTWAAASYVGSDYQVFEGRTTIGVDSGMTYTPPHASAIEPVVPGVTSCTVRNGEAVQNAVLSHGYADIDTACDALNAVYTSVDLVMTPVDTAPRSTVYSDSDVALSVGQGINLGAA